jgi:hypothetical protein
MVAVVHDAPPGPARHVVRVDGTRDGDGGGCQGRIASGPAIASACMDRHTISSYRTLIANPRRTKVDRHMAMSTSWAIAELNEFIRVCQDHDGTYARLGDRAHRNPTIKAMHDDAMTRMPIVEQIADRTWPVWRKHLRRRVSPSWEYEPLVQIAKQLVVMLNRRSELEQNLGEVGPALSASGMHPDVWDAAKSLWRNGHFGEAVSAAARSVNAKLQSKVARKDASETKLINECFSLDPPRPGVPRLRLMADDGSDTFKNLHGGAMAFGQGCFRAIRNVLAHEYGSLSEPPEDEALHYLAAFSVLARWIDQATVER